MIIPIPPIYEEDVIGLLYQQGNASFKYYEGNNIFEIIFKMVYALDFVDFDYIQETEWTFGLELVNESKYIENLVKDMSEEKKKRAFGGEYNQVQHYKLVIDDVGIYNVVCKGIDLKTNLIQLNI